MRRHDNLSYTLLRVLHVDGSPEEVPGCKATSATLRLVAGVAPAHQSGSWSRLVPMKQRGRMPTLPSQVTSVERIGTTYTPTVEPFLREIEAAGWPGLSYHLTVQAPAEWWLTAQIGALVIRFFPAGYDTRNKERPRYFPTPRAVGFAEGAKVWETSLAEGLRISGGSP